MTFPGQAGLDRHTWHILLRHCVPLVHVLVLLVPASWPSVGQLGGVELMIGMARSGGPARQRRERMAHYHEYNPAYTFRAKF